MTWLVDRFALVLAIVPVWPSLQAPDGLSLRAMIAVHGLGSVGACAGMWLQLDGCRTVAA